jgi:hypothetical protein
MSDELDPWDQEAWQPLLDFVDELESERAAEATAGLDADADLDRWLSAMWEALGPMETVLGPGWCAGGVVRRGGPAVRRGRRAVRPAWRRGVRRRGRL